MTGRLDPLEAALLAAWNASEPELPECHLCGNSRGPWVPEPSGDRWPSGAQKFVCQGGCEAAKGVHSTDTLPAADGEKGVRIVGTPGGDLDGVEVAEQTRKGTESVRAPGGERGTPSARNPGERASAAADAPGGRRRAPLSVRMDDDLAADLAVMARAGLNASDAARVALGIVAGTYANAWAAGAVPEGVQPEITECAVRPYGRPPVA